MNHKAIIICILMLINLKAYTITSDFELPKRGWQPLVAKGIKGQHEIFNIKIGNPHLFLYRLSADSEIGINAHDNWEEVVIIEGNLNWLNANGNIQQVLKTGAYVNRPPHKQHGPFKAGKEGCLMFVKMYE